MRNNKSKTQLEYLINIVGLDKLLNRYPHELSGGQKQRLAIARALAPSTNFILLDEPFCSLDMHVKLKLRSELPNILKSCNASGLMVTHDPEEAMSICDKVAVMNEGKIHQIDTPINLLTNPKTLFVSSFILGNNILNLKKDEDSYLTCLGKIDFPQYSDTKKLKYLSVNPKFIAIRKSSNGNGSVVAKEFLGDYFMYKVYIKGETLRARTNTNNSLNIGDKCFLNIKKDNYCFIYPGAYKVII